jgi:pheromone shutdown protein TraB
MLILGFLFAGMTMVACLVTVAMRGAMGPDELLAWVIVAAVFPVSGALAGRGRD